MQSWPEFCVGEDQAGDFDRSTYGGVEEN
uniref:Uncharacterized protein n=1 Tax=Rhizophora mucronata TaxID=61149 RepID=A0A2P2QBK2_RHIMU